MPTQACGIRQCRVWIPRSAGFVESRSSHCSGDKEGMRPRPALQHLLYRTQQLDTRPPARQGSHMLQVELLRKPEACTCLGMSWAVDRRLAANARLVASMRLDAEASRDAAHMGRAGADADVCWAEVGLAGRMCHLEVASCNDK
jgi:hypothetical protein